MILFYTNKDMSKCKILNRTHDIITKEDEKKTFIKVFCFSCYASMISIERIIKTGDKK
jgi:hypothetical protein